ncbi:MAG: hypothetical protein PWQ55_2601 [Chloroflexota bacterium]|nr:hypothetical protein [Chloroflexota bacterium]
MKYTATLNAVRDMQKARRFYQDVLDLEKERASYS